MTEREQIVAWLRGELEAGRYKNSHARDAALFRAANAIEDGDHLTTKEG